MKLKMKALKWWQGLLIAIGGVALAIGGVFLYVYFTSGIGAKKVYPEDIAFEIKDENGQALEGYNEELGQFEMSENFSMRIGTQTEGVNRNTLTLSFTSNFTETAVDGYITNGVISIPQKVTIGKDFEVKVEQIENWNVGGIATIYASTENKLLLPTSAKIAIDVPVKNIGAKIEDTSSSRVYEAKNGVFNIIKDTNVRISALFTPEDSKYIFSDNETSKENKRMKNYFIEVLDGKDNFVMNRDAEGIYFTSAGALDSTAKIKIYTFKNSKDQLDFYSTFNEGISDEEIYNSAIVELSQKPEKACVVETNIKIVEATVSEFKVSRTQKMELNTNKLYTIRANSNTFSDLVLGTTILDDMKEPVPAMISKVAMRLLKRVDENWVETDEVKLVGGATAAIEGANYTFINASVRDLNNAYWEISSKEDGAEYRAEIVLLVSDGGYKIFNNQKYSFDISFKEHVDASVSWNVDDTTINMIVFTGQESSSTQYEKKLNELISVPAQNLYTRVVYLAYNENWNNTSEEEAKTYISIKSYKDYTFSKPNGGTETLYMAELDSSYLSIKKGIEGLKIRFVTVKTDAYGNILLDENGKYQIVKWSNDLTINALEMISGFSETSMEILTTNCDPYEDVEKGYKYYILSKDKTMQFKINLDDAQKNLFKKQYEQGLISFKVLDFENKMEYSDLIDTITFDNETLIFTVKFKDSIATSSGRKITFKLNYNPTLDTSMSYEIKAKNSETNDFGYLTVYESTPETIKSTLNGPYNVKAEQNGSEWNISIEGTTLDEINSKISETKVFDKYGIEVTEKFPISLSTSNSRILEVNADKTISFNNNLSDKPENVTLSINSGSADGINITFTFTAAKVTKIDYLKDSKVNQETDSSSDYDTKTTDLNSVIIKKLGYNGNTVTLSNLIKVYTGIDESEYNVYTNLSFRLRGIAGMGENKEYLLEENGMFDMSFENDDASTDITTETKIKTITVKHDFYGDYTLQMRVEGLGISIDLDIIFMNNVTATCQLPSIYQQGETGTVSKPEDVVIGNVTYTGVYADYAIDMDNFFKVSKIKQGDKFSWGEGGFISGSDDEVTREGKTLTFNPVYAQKEVVFIIYEVEGNPFAFNQSFKCYVYPNIQHNLKESTLNFEDIVNSRQKISDYFEVCKYVYTENSIVEGLSYKIVNQNVKAVTIDEDENTFKRNAKDNKPVKLNLRNGATEEAFEVSVKKGENVVTDYKGEDIIIPMNLSLKTSYDAIIENNKYFSKVMYGGNKIVMLTYTSVGALELNTKKSEGDDIAPGCDFDIIGTENTSIIQKLANKQFQIMGLTGILSYGPNFYLPITMKITSGEESGVEVATFRIPLLISQVDSIYAYYRNYNDNNNFDLKILLSSATDLKDFPQDIYAQFNAGTNPIVVHAAKITRTGENIKVNGKTYSWKVEDEKLTLTLSEDDSSIEAEGQNITIDGSNYLWSHSEGVLTLTLESKNEGFYLPSTGIWTSSISVLKEQTLIKLTSEQISGRIPGKNITLKLTSDSNETYSSWDKIKLGGADYTWTITDGKLVLTKDKRSFTEVDNGQINVSGTTYEISYWMLADSDDTGLVTINNESDESISISNLANVDRFVVLQMKLSSTSGSFSYIYRIKVAHNLKVSKEYPYGGNVEYIGVDGELTKDLSALENGKRRFVIKDNSGNSPDDISSTNSIKSITVNNKEYTIGGALYNLVFEENADTRTYKAGSTVTIKFKGDNMTILTNEKNVGVVMVKSYNGVVNGELEYSFLLNVSDKKYVIKLGDKTIDHNGTDEKTLNPGGDQKFTVLTMTKAGSTETGVGDNVSTIISVGAGFTLETGTAGTYTLKEGEQIIATIKYDPKSPSENLTITPTGSFTEPVKFDLLFTAQEMEDGNIILNQPNIATISFTIDRTIKITENTAQLYGGKTYDFVGKNGLIGKIEKFESNAYNEGYTNDTIKIECKVLINPGTTEEVKEEAKFVKVDNSNKIVKFAMLKEDMVVEFTVTITDDGNEYIFKFKRTLEKSVTYANGKDLADNKDNAYIYNEKEERTSGTSKPIEFGNFATFVIIKDEPTGFSDGTFAIVSVNGDKDYDKSSSGGYKVEINTGSGQITITPENVAVRQVRSYAIEISYTFNGTFNYKFFVNVNLTVNPNTKSEVHYPSLDEKNELGYETVKATDKEITWGNIWDDFFSKPAELGKSERIKFSSIKANTTSTSETDTSATEKITIEAIKEEDLSCVINEQEVTLRLAEGKSAGTVIFNVKKNEVSALYEVYLIAGEVYTINKNYTISSETRGTEKIDRFNRDSLADKKIFANDRLIALDIPVAIDTALNGKVVTIEYIVKETGTTATTKFLLDTNKKGLTIYIEAGNSVKEITSIKVASSDTDYKDAWNAGITERITLSYTTKEGPKQIAKNLVVGSVTKLDSTDLSENNSFDKYDISSLQNTDTTYTATFSLKVNGNGKEVLELNNKDYKFCQILDIAVGNSYENSFITISVNETNDSKRDLVKLANIHHPSTNLPLSAEDLKNSGVEVSLRVLSEIDTLNLSTNTVYQNHKDDIDKSFTAMKENETKFLSYTDMKVTYENKTKIWNYLLYGEGATNNGSWALLEFTYKAEGTTKTFYIWVRILPDYDFKINGTSITVLDGDTYSVSNNLNQPYEVTPVATSGETSAAYNVTLTSATGNPILTIVDTNTNSSDKAFNWTYKITQNAEEGGIKYNVDLNKIYNNNSSNTLATTSDGERTIDLLTPTPGIKQVVLTKQAKNIFGKKLYKIDVSNEYGYEAQIYISFLPENREDPTVHSSTTLNTITEGDSFDIGAVYTSLTLSATKEGDTEETKTIYVLNEDIHYTLKEGSTTEWTYTDDSTKTKISSKTQVDVTAEGSDTSETYTIKYNEITISDVPKSKVGTENEKKYKDWSFKAVEAKASDRNNSVNSFINIAGIDAWTFSDSSISDITVNKAGFPTIEDKYLNPEKMLLRYVKITEIEYLYGDNKVRVGKDENLSEKLAFDEKAKLIKGEKIEANATYPEKIKLTTETVGEREMADTIFKVPYLDDWVYSSYASSKNDTDLVPVTMRIKLQYSKPDEGTNQTEEYYLTHDITVRRNLNVDKTKQAVVRDGVEFNLAEVFNKETTGGAQSQEKYFSYEAKNEVGITVNNVSYIDDTLVVTLPESKGKDQNLTVDIEVKNSTILAKGSFSIKNTNTRMTTYYNSISKYLKVVEGNKVTSKGYLIKNGDTIKFTFSNFENNDSIIGGETYSYDKFYATYGMKKLDTATLNEDIYYTTDERGTEKKWVKTSTNTTEKIQKGDRIKVIDDPSSSTEKCKIEYNGITISEVLVSYLDYDYETANTWYYSKTGDGGTTSSTLAKTSDLKYTTDEITVNTQTHDKINISTSELFSTTRMPEVTKSYIVCIGRDDDSSKEHSYRVEKNWIVTPVYYFADSGLSHGSDISERKDAEYSTETSDTPDSYIVDFNTWASGISYAEGIGNMNLPEKRSVTDEKLAAGRLNIMIGNKETAGTASVNSYGSVTTRSGYVLDSDEYIQLVVRVRAAGVDGTFSHSSDKDYLLGNLRLFVKEKQSTSGS